MKKLFTMTLAVLLIFVLTACGADYSKHQFDFFGDNFRWDMTVEGAKEFIEQKQLVKSEIEIDRYDSFTTVQDDMYIFRFDGEGQIEFVKYDMGYDREMVRILQDWYGEYDEYDSSFDSYIWYGTMAGRNTVMTFYTVSGQCYLQFEPA